MDPSFHLLLGLSLLHGSKWEKPGSFKALRWAEAVGSSHNGRYYVPREGKLEGRMAIDEAPDLLPQFLFSENKTRRFAYKVPCPLALLKS